MAENPLYKPAKPMLLARGFRKSGGVQVFLGQLSPEVFGWVGLNARSDPGRLTLSPTVGVRHERVSRWVAVCLDSDPKSWTGPTVQTGMGLLLPDGRHFPHWVLVRDEDERNAETWETFGRDLDDFVMPWMLARSTGAQLVEALRRNEGLDTSRLSLPVLLWILGDPDGARQALEAGRASKPRSGIVVDYDGFAERLLAEIDARPDGPAD